MLFVLAEPVGPSRNKQATWHTCPIRTPDQKRLIRNA